MALRKRNLRPDANRDPAELPVIRCEVETKPRLRPKEVHDGIRGLFELTALLVAAAGSVTEVSKSDGSASSAELHLRDDVVDYDSPHAALALLYATCLRVENSSYRNPMSSEVLALTSLQTSKGLSALIRTLATLRSEMRIRKAEADEKERDVQLRMKLLEESAEREVLQTEKARAEIDGMELENDLVRLRVEELQLRLQEEKERQARVKEGEKRDLAQLIIDAQNAAVAEGVDVVPWSLPFAIAMVERAHEHRVYKLLFERDVVISVLDDDSDPLVA